MNKRNIPSVPFLKHRAWILLAGSLSMLFAGLLYSWSILKMPLAVEFGWRQTQLSVNYTIMICAFCFGGIVAGFMQKKRAPHVSIIIGLLITASGFYGTSLLCSNNLSLLYLCYGCFCGFGIGMAYNAILSGTTTHFFDRSSLCTGVLMMSFGFSTLLLGSIASHMLQGPLGWRNVYRLIGSCIGIVFFVDALLLKNAQPASLPAVKAAQSSSHVHETPPGKMLRSVVFWKYSFFAICMLSVGSTVISIAKDISVSVGASDVLATLLTGIAAVCNGIVRTVIGLVYERLGQRKTLLMVSITSFLSACLLYIAVSANNLPICILGICLAAASFGCGPTLNAVFARTMFGSQNFAANYSLTNLSMIPASMIPILVVSTAETCGGYSFSFILLIALSIPAILFGLNLSISPQKRK